MTYRFVTIGPSHYCEKVRWALDRLQVPYAEDPHCPALHIPRAWWLGGGKTVPVLKAPTGEVFNDSTLALEHLDLQAPPGHSLYPSEHAARVRELEERFDEVLGPHVRRLAYLHLLYAQNLPSVMTHGVGFVERTTFRTTLPLLRPLMKRALGSTRSPGTAPDQGSRSWTRSTGCSPTAGATSSARASPPRT
ncbi:MAG: glutathione S-transferase N-terminal domain-containing protein [Planctomycetota bacterium]